MSKSKLNILIGDMFTSKAEALVNTVNCEGVMGKGIALEFKKRFPEMFKEYVAMSKSGKIVTGALTIHKNLFQDKIVINFPTKKHWRSPTLVQDIENGLDYFISHHKDWGIKSVAFPPLGCGNGGLTWEVVGPLMYSKIGNLELDIEIYAPFGTSKDKLTETYLKNNINSHRPVKGSFLRGSLQDGEVMLLETLYRLQNRAYAKPIGRIMFQKACYILTEAGAPTGFEFTKGTYGPYSSQVKRSLTILANNNLTTEEKNGNMLKTSITDNYINFRKDYIQLIDMNEKYISKAVDLLSRIKDTNQGEEVATVMHAANVLRLNNKRTPEDTEVLEYIYEWKNNWKIEDKKRITLADTVSNLAMMGWIKVNLTDSTVLT